MSTRTARPILLLLALLAAPSAARAAESAPSVTPRATVSLVSDTDAVAPGTQYHLGLRLRLAPGWHTYSRNPGDAGVPAELDWTVPDGTRIGDIAWPTPQRLPEGDLMTFGYTGEALLAMPATGPGPVKVHASWLVCNNICVPEEADFSLDLPQGTPAPSAQAPLFAAAEAARPRPSPFHARIAPDGMLTVSGDDLPALAVRDAWFVPDAPNQIAASAKQTLVTSTNNFTLKLTPADGFKAGAPLTGVLVLHDATGPDSALAIQAMPGAAIPTTSLWRALGFALLGGLILNLMPCVFPVLAMKAFAIARLAHGHRRQAQAQAGAYTLGVLATFAAIGLGLVVFRGLGHAAGWGFQFQSPVFVAAMAWVLFAVGLNLSGVFGIQTQLVGAGQSLTSRGGLTGSFFGGALVVLVATPCTAPFMGVAIAAALTSPPAETLAVFLAMGLGLAVPTALLALIPGAARILPRPGRWMDLLKQGLAFPMYAAAAWLTWVISLQAGPDGVLATAAGLVLIGFAAWSLRLGARTGRTLALTACLLALALLPSIGSADAPPPTEASAERFSPSRLASLRAEGKPVFVNMTAAWCVTCLVNERVALNPAPVRAAFDAAGVTLLKGDWTRQDPQISAFLRAQGRDGVPLYVFYPAEGRPPVVLPQLLTEASVLDTLKTYEVGRP